MNTQREVKLLIQTPASRLWIVENFYPDVSNKFKDLPLEEEPIIIFRGTKCHQRRDVGFFSNQSDGYQYSGQIAKSTLLDAHPILIEILNEVNVYLGTSFNGVLLNRYKNGEKYISAHSDSEIGLDKNRKTVAGLAFGAIRKFRIRDKILKNVVMDIEHLPGTLIVMEGEFQQEFTHEIPKQLRVKEERWSLTFRCHLK